MLAVLCGVAFVMLGFWMRRNADRFYSIMCSTLGAGAFPESGTKAERIRKFLADYGGVVVMLGVLVAVLGLFRAVAELVGALK